jgi:hypothetical protein
VTPPPDFDLEAWLDSIRRIWPGTRAARAHSLWRAPEPARHLEELRAGLLAWAGYARIHLSVADDASAQLRWFVQQLEVDRRAVAAESAQKFLAGAGPEACWHGLVRYWRKR